MTRYAERTEVSSDRSRAEIEATLKRYGADQFMYGWDEEQAVIGFRITGRMVKFLLPLPDRNAREFTHSSRGPRSVDVAEKAWQQVARQRWRALALVIKAKLEAVEAGITTAEQEFLSGILLPDGSTVADWARPQLEQAYLTGRMPPLLPMLTNGSNHTEATRLEYREEGAQKGGVA